VDLENQAIGLVWALYHLVDYRKPDWEIASCPVAGCVFDFAFLTVWITVFALMTPFLASVVSLVDTHYSGYVLDFSFSMS
jgi:hypothetical protein